MAGKILTALTKIEAESYWSRGKLREAMDIYTKLLVSSPDMTLGTRATIEARIQVLREELERPSAREDGLDIETAIKKLQEAAAPDESILDLRLDAEKFYRQGLYADAMENLKQLIRQNTADEFCVDTVVGCLVQLHPPEELPVAVDLLLVESFRNAEKASQFKLVLAKKMAQKGHLRHADVLLRHEDRFSSSTL
jgi:tetratricopeptide (TPR) repeat protein